MLVPKFQATVNKHGVEHHIVRHGHPIFAHPRRLPADKFSAAKDEFTKMKKPALSVDQTPHGLRLYISYPSSQVDGDHAATTDGLM